MADSLPPCPACSCEYTYELGALLVCPECAHEWAPTDAQDTAEDVVAMLSATRSRTVTR